MDEGLGWEFKIREGLEARNRRDKEIRAARAERGPGRSHTGEQPGRVCVQARGVEGGEGGQACRGGVGREGWRGSARAGLVAPSWEES